MPGWGSQLQLFQVGDMSFHGHLLSYPEEKIQSRGDTEVMVSSYKMLMPDASYLIKPRTYSLEMQIYSTDNWGSGQFIQKFKNLIGKVTDIFAFEIVRDNPDKIACGCPICECCTCDLLWLHNIGRITDISVKSGDYWSFTASIGIEVQSYWKPVNRLIWEWKRVGATSRFETDWENSWLKRIRQYPNCDMMEEGQCFFWYKRCRPSLTELYDPDYFTALHCYHRLNYPATGYTSHWSTINDRHFITIFEWVWSAPPLSQYYFMNLTQLNGDITITVRSEYNQCAKICTTTIVEATLLSELTAVGITLADSDILVVGDTRGFAHLMRNGEIIAYLAEAVSFTCGDWPGQILPGSNTVEIEPNGSRFSMHHYYRRL